MKIHPDSIPFDQLAVDQGHNPTPDAPCPNCGDEHDIARASYVGIAMRDGARLCTRCINTSIPGLAAVLDVVIDLQYVLEEAEEPGLLAAASRGLLKAASRELLYDIDWHATNARNTIRPVPNEAS